MLDVGFLFLWGFGFLVELGLPWLFGIFGQKGSPHISVNQWTQCTAIPNQWFAPAHNQVALSQTSPLHPFLSCTGEAQTWHLGTPDVRTVLFPSPAARTAGLCHKGTVESCSVHCPPGHPLVSGACWPQLLCGATPPQMHWLFLNFTRLLSHHVSSLLRAAALLCSETIFLDLVPLSLAEYPVHPHQSNC